MKDIQIIIPVQLQPIEATFQPYGHRKSKSAVISLSILPENE